VNETRWWKRPRPDTARHDTLSRTFTQVTNRSILLRTPTQQKLVLAEKISVQAVLKFMRAPPLCNCSARKTRCLHKREHKVARAPGDTLLLFLLGHPPRFPLTLWLTNQHKSILYTGYGSAN
jgi:hypothetical protein